MAPIGEDKNTGNKETEEKTEMVEIPKSQLESILKRLDAVESKDSDIVDDEIREHFVKVKLVEGQPLSDVQNAVQTGTNPRGEAVMICDITVIDKNGKDKVIKGFNYVKVRELEYVTCKLIKEKKTKKVRELGTVPERVFDHASGLTKETGKKVVLKENVVVVEYVVDFNDEELTLKGVNF